MIKVKFGISLLLRIILLFVISQIVLAQRISDDKFENLAINKKIDYITFTSPSTIIGFLKRIKNKELIQKLFDVKIISIGPVTTKAANEHGFRNILTADPYTTDGMIDKLKELNS